MDQPFKDQFKIWLNKNVVVDKREIVNFKQFSMKMYWEKNGNKQSIHLKDVKKIKSA